MADNTKLADDFKVHDAYVAFSAEVVRLALLGLTAISFLVVTAGKRSTLGELLSAAKPGLWWLASGGGLLAFAIALGLIHRYFAIDYMATYIEFLRGKGDHGREWRRIASTIAIIGAGSALALGFLLLFAGAWLVLKSSV